MSVYDKLGLFKDINPCDSDFVGKLNFNFKALDSISFGVVKAIVSELPLNPSDQDVYILNESGQYSFHFFDNGVWQPLDVRAGVSVFIESESWYYWFDGIGFNAWPFDGAADIPIHDRPSASTVNDTDLFLLEQSGQKKKITALDMQSYFGGGDTGSVTLEMLTQAVLDKLTPIGTVITSLLKTAPSGYIEADGKSLGKVGSGADYEGDQYKLLFEKLWELDFVGEYSLDLPISITGGKGVSANDDWNLGRVIRINLKLGDSFPRFGANVGEYVGDKIRDIGGSFNYITKDGLVYSYYNPYEPHGVFTPSVSNTFTASMFNPTGSSATTTVRQTTYTYDPTKAEGVVIGNEFKPKSITYNVFVKY